MPAFGSLVVTAGCGVCGDDTTLAEIGAVSGVFGFVSCGGGAVVLTVAAAAEARVVIVGFVLGCRHVCELLSWSSSESPFLRSSSSSLNSILSNSDFFSGSFFFGVSFGLGGSGFGCSSSAGFG